MSSRRPPWSGGPGAISPLPHPLNPALHQSNCFKLRKVASSAASLWRESASHALVMYASFKSQSVELKTINTIAGVHAAFQRLRLPFC